MRPDRPRYRPSLSEDAAPRGAFWAAGICRMSRRSSGLRSPILFRKSLSGYGGMSASGECRAACARWPCRFPFYRRFSEDGRFRCDEDRVAHGPAGTTVLGFDFLPKPRGVQLELRTTSLISLRRRSLSLSLARLRPPGNIPRPSRFRLTSSTNHASQPPVSRISPYQKNVVVDHVPNLVESGP